MIQPKLGVFELFQECLELPPEKWASLLEQRCGIDAKTRDEVLSLLESQRNEATDPFEHPEEQLAGAMAEGSNDVPAEIGPYPIVREISRGGMGVIYLATHPVVAELKVAIKVVQQLASPGARARFEQERKHLSQLQNNHIARIFGGGTTSDQSPYLVMEYVPGLPITDYCEKENLDTRERIALFIQVCGAVQHAHTKAKVHRDLKPGNVLVASDGGIPVAKVIDFGIARDLDEVGDGLTVDGALLGTCEYMSPEQADGREVDTRSDIYALGLLLYELIAGVRPFNWDDVPRAQRLSIAQQGEVPRPSTRVRSASRQSRRKESSTFLSRELAGDLDAILLKALFREPEKRYQTCSQLAEDLQRYLDNEAVAARPPSAVYRTRKFVRKHWAGVAIAVLVFVALFAVTMSSLQEARTASRNRDYVLALQDHDTAADLIDEMRYLWPTSKRGDEFKEWLARAGALVERQVDRRETVVEFLSRQEVSQLANTASAGGPAEIDGRLDELRDCMQAMLDRHAVCYPKDDANQPSTAGAWRHALRRIGQLDVYAGLKIEPQPELMPLRYDPQSGLWEFVHLPSGIPPAIDGAEAPIVAGETGVILVLLPAQAFRMGAQGAALGGGFRTTEGGLKITDVIPGSIAEQLELPIGCILTRVNGYPIQMIGDLEEALAVPPPDWSVTADILQDGQPRTLHGHALDRPDPHATNREYPVHEVRLDAYFISRYEMTQGQWKRLGGGEPSRYAGLDRPVETVSWIDAKKVLDGFGLTLPTEAQWECAARAGTREAWWTGAQEETLSGADNLLDRWAKTDAEAKDWPYEDWLNDGKRAHGPVGEYRANPFGLHDVHGNVAEICLDGWQSYEAAPAPATGLRNVEAGGAVIRGGAWNNSAEESRSSARRGRTRDYRHRAVGLRPVYAKTFPQKAL